MVDLMTSFSKIWRQSMKLLLTPSNQANVALHLMWSKLCSFFSFSMAASGRFITFSFAIVCIGNTLAKASSKSLMNDLAQAHSEFASLPWVAMTSPCE
jgi:hypothetical protein